VRGAQVEGVCMRLASCTLPVASGCGCCNRRTATLAWLSEEQGRCVFGGYQQLILVTAYNNLLASARACKVLLWLCWVRRVSCECGGVMCKRSTFVLVKLLVCGCLVCVRNSGCCCCGGSASVLAVPGNGGLDCAMAHCATATTCDGVSLSAACGAACCPACCPAPEGARSGRFWSS